MSTVQGEDIYGSIEDTGQEIQDTAKTAKNIYDTGKKIHDSLSGDHDGQETEGTNNAAWQDADAAYSGADAGSDADTWSAGSSAAENLYGDEPMEFGAQSNPGGASGGYAGAEGVSDFGGAAETAGGVAEGTGSSAAAGSVAAGGSAAGGAGAEAGAGAAAGGAAAAGGGAAAGSAAAGGGAAAGGAAAGAGAGAAAGGGIVILIVVAIVFVLLLLFTLFSSMNAEGQGSTGHQYVSAQYSKQRGNYSGKFEEGNNDNRPEDDPDYDELQSYHGRSPYLKAYCQFVPFMKGTQQFLNGIQGDELLEGTVKQMKEDKGFANTVGVFEKAKKLAVLDGKDWIKDLERTNPLGDWNGLSSEITLGRLESASNDLFQNIDYAELIDVISQNPKYDLKNMTEKDFRAVFLGNRDNRTTILRKYYYLHIEPKKSTYGALGVATITRDEEGNVIYDNSDDPLDYGEVTLEKYNLDELYTICAGPDAAWEVNSDFNPDSIDHIHDGMTNFDKLKWMERRTRAYGAYNVSKEKGWNHETAVRLFGDSNPSGRGEIRSRRGFDHADFSYWVSETFDDLFSALHGLFQNDEDASTGGGFVENNKNKKILNMYRYINQGDAPQASLPFAGGTYQQYGCAPSSYIMVIEYFLRKEVNIESAIKKYSAGSAGIYGNAMINAYGGNASQTSYSGPEQIISEIDDGKPVILSLRGYNSFHHTSGGHYVVIMGYDEEGFYMYDPGNRGNTYGYGTTNCTVSYEQFAKDAGTFQSIYTFDFPNVTIPEFSDFTSGSNVSFDVDEETVSKVEAALQMKYMSGAKAYAMEYALLTQKYGSNFAIGFMANMKQESSGTGGLDQKTGKVFTSGADIQNYINSNTDWSGLGIHQWTSNRKQGLLNQYKEDGLLDKASISQEDLIASELNYLMKELNGAESGVISKCEGKSASECATIIARNFERCGIDGGRAETAKTMYNALQRSGVLD